MSAVDGLGAAPARCRPGPLEMLAGQGVQGDLLHAPSVADTLTSAAELAFPPAGVSVPARASVISASAASCALSSSCSVHPNIRRRSRAGRVGGRAGKGGLGLRWRRRAGGGGTTFPATACPAGITTSFPSLVRTVKDPASACSRMPSTSVIGLLSAGPGRQRITTRLPTSARVSRTSSRYHMPVTCYQGRRPGLPGSRPGVHRRRPLVTECHPVGPTSRGAPNRHSRTVRCERQHTALTSSIPVRELAQLAWCGVGAGQVMAVTANRWVAWAVVGTADGVGGPVGAQGW